jgi:hypothetical protein
LWQAIAMALTNVLAIGTAPRFADFNAIPELTPEVVRAYI